MSKVFYSGSSTTTGTCNVPSCYSTSGASPDRAVAPENTTPLNKSFWLDTGETNGVSIVLTASPGVATWAAGNYTVAVNVTTTNKNITLTEIQLCRRSSACGAVETLGRLTGINRVLGTTGSVDHVISGVAESTGTSTDKLVIYYVGTNASTMATSTAQVQSTITTPITEPLPGTPTASASTVSRTRIDLTLGAGSDAASHTLHRSTTDGFTVGAGNQIASFGATPTSPYENTGLDPGTTYYYRLRATNSGGSTDSTQTTATTNANQPPTTPSIISVEMI
jgi:hypothetical protein